MNDLKYAKKVVLVTDCIYDKLPKIELDKKYPNYNIKSNKGYGTKDHLEALEEFGPVKGLHRFSYKPVKNSLIKKVSLF